MWLHDQGELEMIACTCPRCGKAIDIDPAEALDERAIAEEIASFALEIAIDREVEDLRKWLKERASEEPAKRNMELLCETIVALRNGVRPEDEPTTRDKEAQTPWESIEARLLYKQFENEKLQEAIESLQVSNRRWESMFAETRALARSHAAGQ